MLRLPSCPRAALACCLVLCGCGRIGFASQALAPASEVDDTDASSSPSSRDCGDGIVESELGETCEPGSASAPCPTRCDDAIACTLDSLHGAPQRCDVVCEHVAIEQPNSGDGCCPSAANANNDSDCSPRCGNGVTEAGEQCDGDGRCGAQCKPVLPASLVHRYSFDSAGSIAFDTVGGADGAVINTALAGDGVLTLAGASSDQYVDLPNGLISALTSTTIEVWLTWQGGGELHRIFDFGMNSAGEGENATGRGSYYFYLSPYNENNQSMVGLNFTAALDDYLPADYQVLGAPIAPGTRHQLAVTFRDPGANMDKTLALFIDGALQSSRSVPATQDGVDNRLRTLDDRNVWVGRANYDIPSLAASIDEFRIYNAALSDAELAASFAAGPDP